MMRKTIERMLRAAGGQVKAERVLIGVLALALMFASGVRIGQAQIAPPDSVAGQRPQAAAVTFADAIPIQGRLTDAAGVALNGTYSVTFSTYTVPTGGSGGCVDTDLLTLVNGLFNTTIDGCGGGGGSFGRGDQQLYLGIKVGTDPEMTPRHRILGTPYAQGLRTPLDVGGTTTSPTITFFNDGTGRAAHFIDDVSQDACCGGIVKAGISATCSDSAPAIIKQFSTADANGTILDATIASGGGVGKCAITYGWQAGLRYVLATAITTGYNPRSVSCSIVGAFFEIDCFRFDAAGNGVNGDIMVVVY